MSIQPSRKEHLLKTIVIVVLGLSGSICVHAIIRLVIEAPTTVDWELLGSAFPVITAPIIWIAKRSNNLWEEFTGLKERVKKLEEREDEWKTQKNEHNALKEQTKKLEERDEEWKTQKNEHNWLKVRLDHHETRLDDLEND